MRARLNPGGNTVKNTIETYGICPECNEVITGDQKRGLFKGHLVHSACKPTTQEEVASSSESHA
jgi:translation initiation factor 2 beta subunit (eIF-2beta)/eIF-5